MTPRDELREAIKGELRDLFLGPGPDRGEHYIDGWRRGLGDAETIIVRALDALPSLPAGGGDGREVTIWFCEDCTEAGLVEIARGTGVYEGFQLVKAAHAVKSEACDKQHHGGRVRVTIATLDPVPASSPAGDEAREARAALNALCGEWGDVPSLLRAVSNGTAAEAAQCNSNSAQRATDALRRVADEWDRRSLSSPLQGAGTVTVCFPEAEAAALAMDATVENELAASAIKRIGDALANAPADEETTR